MKERGGGGERERRREGDRGARRKNEPAVALEWQQYLELYHHVLLDIGVHSVYSWNQIKMAKEEWGGERIRRGRRKRKRRKGGYLAMNCVNLFSHAHPHIIT